MSAWTVEEWERAAAWSGSVTVEGGVEGLLRMQLEYTAQLGALLAERPLVAAPGAATWDLVTALRDLAAQHRTKDPKEDGEVAAIDACLIAEAWVNRASSPPIVETAIATPPVAEPPKGAAWDLVAALDALADTYRGAHVNSSAFLAVVLTIVRAWLDGAKEPPR